MRERVSPRAVFLLVLVLAAGLYGWNAGAQRGFWGYDEGGHAAYALSIRETGALPQPLSGWSTFHPPVYYLLSAATWALVEPIGPRAALAGLRFWSALGILAAAGAVFVLARGQVRSAWLALAAGAIVLCVPVAQLAATMVGNEALAAGLTALALVPLVSLQQDPSRLRSAAWAGLLAGLALATKFTGAWVLAACAVPFLRPGLDARALRALGVCFGVALLVAGPFYARNLATTGTLVPMTRTLEPMKRMEERLVREPRRWTDYVVVPWTCGVYPYVTVVVEGGVWAGLNPAMQSVPCLAYAGLWFDPFGLRATRRDPREGLGWGTGLLYAGLVPTVLVVLGFGFALVRSVQSRGRAREAPLVVVAVLSVASYVVFTWLAPSLGAAKASYLLPALAPAGVFFAAGCQLLGPAVRRVALAVSLGAALLAVYVFTTGTVFAPTDAAASRGFWSMLGRELPGSYVTEAATRLIR